MTDTVYIGRKVGVPLTLRRIRKRVEEQFADEKKWKAYFRKEVLPEMENILERNTKLFARTRVGRTLERSVKIGRGGAGRGVFALTARLQGEGAKYGLIHNKGGVIRAKGDKHLTIPTQVHLALGGGEKLFKMRDLKKGQGFTITYKGRKTVFEKGKHIPGAGIRPMFILEKEHTIKPTYWADDALDKSLTEFDRFAIQKMAEFLRRRRT